MDGASGRISEARNQIPYPTPTVAGNGSIPAKLILSSQVRHPWATSFPPPSYSKQTPRARRSYLKGLAKVCPACIFIPLSKGLQGLPWVVVFLQAVLGRSYFLATRKERIVTHLKFPKSAEHTYTQEEKVDGVALGKGCEREALSKGRFSAFATCFHRVWLGDLIRSAWILH